MKPILYTHKLIAAMLAAALLLQGCAAVVVGAAAGTVHDRRATSAVVSDRNISLTAYDTINRDKELVRNDNSVKVVVYGGVMLLCGQVRSEELKHRAQSHVEVINGVRRIVNDLQVTEEPEGFWRRREDNTITARVKTAMLNITSLPGFDPLRVNVTTSHHIVYLMGFVSHEEADAAIEVARNTGSVEKVVNVFEYVETEAAPAPTAP